MSVFIEGDCHIELKKLNDNSIDFIYTSPPYGTTCAKWDKPLKWDIIFPELWRILKPDGIIALHAAIPFTYTLLKYETPKYHYVWKKNNSTNFFKAKIQPLRDCEEVFIYYKKNGTYNPQMKGDEFYKKRLNKMGAKNSYYDIRTNIDKSKWGEGGHTGKYPTTFLEYKIRKDETGITRNDDMMDFFIKTYTNENDTILDFTCHNNYLEKRCSLLKRKFIGIDIDLQI